MYWLIFGRHKACITKKLIKKNQSNEYYLKIKKNNQDYSYIFETTSGL
jgi:hypothetical protein